MIISNKPKNLEKNRTTKVANIDIIRIVCEVEQGQDLKQGDRLGMIRFGSRVDIYFKNKKFLAKTGQNVLLVKKFDCNV